MLKWFVRAIDQSNKWVGLIASYMLFIAASVTLFEVIARFAFDRPTDWAQETTGQMFGFYFIMGGGYVLLNKAHIRIDVLWSRFSPKRRAFADLATCGFSFLFLGVLLWFSVRMAQWSVLTLEISKTPFGPAIYPLKISLAIGVLLLLLQLISKTIRDLYLVIKGGELA